MMVQDLTTGRSEPLGTGTTPYYSSNGYLVYQASTVIEELWAVPFSLDTLKATGEAFPIAQSGCCPTVANDGTLVYVDGSSSGERRLAWIDRGGNKTGEIGRVQDSIRHPALSPDGQFVAAEARESSSQDIWSYGIGRPMRTRLSSAKGKEVQPVWSPSGDEIAFSSQRAGNYDIYLRKADGSGEEKVVAASPWEELVCDWSRDGKYLLYRMNEPQTGRNLWYLELNEDDMWQPHPFLQTPFEEPVAKFSPDGRYVAYVSNESGQWDVYVEAFPEGGDKRHISSRGGSQPRWRPDGKEMFYLQGDTLMSVPVSLDPGFAPGSPSPLFEHSGLSEGSYPQYDVSANGQRFIVCEPLTEQGGEPLIRVVQNWFAEFRHRKPE